jgi:aspartokinase
METIAVYWEPKIRVYGLMTETGLSLYTLTFPVERLARWGGLLKSLGQKGTEFLLVNLQQASAGSMQLCLVPMAGVGAAEVAELLAKGLENEIVGHLQVTEPVELIYLHGPHFQDRYGIAEAALRPLYNAGIPILTTGCAGTSVSIVVSENRAREVAACLAETFVL